MVLITFQHSIKYIYAQLAPYPPLIAAAGFLSWHESPLWIPVYCVLGLLMAWHFIELSAVTYLFTHDMLIISKGVLIKQIDCRALWQLKGVEVRSNRLLTWLHVSNIHCGLEGPPADRIRITGVDNQTMLKVLDQLAEGIETNLEFWRQHFLSIVA